jgi:hypothetical protein
LVQVELVQHQVGVVGLTVAIQYSLALRASAVAVAVATQHNLDQQGQPADLAVVLTTRETLQEMVAGLLHKVSLVDLVTTPQQPQASPLAVAVVQVQLA